MPRPVVEKRPNSSMFLATCPEIFGYGKDILFSDSIFVVNVHLFRCVMIKHVAQNKLCSLKDRRNDFGFHFKKSTSISFHFKSKYLNKQINKQIDKQISKQVGN